MPHLRHQSARTTPASSRAASPEVLDPPVVGSRPDGFMGSDHVMRIRSQYLSMCSASSFNLDKLGLPDRATSPTTSFASSAGSDLSTPFDAQLGSSEEVLPSGFIPRSEDLQNQGFKDDGFLVLSSLRSMHPRKDSELPMHPPHRDIDIGTSPDINGDGRPDAIQSPTQNRHRFASMDSTLSQIQPLSPFHLQNRSRFLHERNDSVISADEARKIADMYKAYLLAPVK